jgi:phage gpG-like protein
MPLPGFVQRGPKAGPLHIGNVVDLNWEPSPYIVAAQLFKFGMDIRTFKEPLTKSVKEVAIPSIRKNFEAEGRPEPWAPLAEYTVMRRLDEGFGEGPILQRTGKLMKAATAFARWQVSDDDATITGDFPRSVWYAKIMQEGISISGQELAEQKGLVGGAASSLGGRFPRKKGEVVIPPRPFMVLQDEDIDKIEHVFDEWLSAKARAAGLI